jgi:hypothetical protein
MDIKKSYILSCTIAFLSGLITAHIFASLLNDWKTTNNINTCLKVEGTDLDYCKKLVERMYK